MKRLVAQEMSKKDRKDIEKYKLKKIDEENTPYHATVTAQEDTTYIAYFDNRDSMVLGRDLQILYYIQDPFVIPEKK